MKQPVPVRGNAPVLREPSRHTQVDLKVRFYDRMRVQRVYPLVVEVPSGATARPAHGQTLDPVVVRPVIPGALVVPAEQKLDVTRPGERASFHVTPLARGRFPSPYVEILHHGKLVQGIPLRMKGVTQRLTLFLLILALLLPWPVFYYTRTNKLKGFVPVKTKPVDLGAGDKQGQDQQKAAPVEKPGAGKKEGALPFDPSRVLVLLDDEKKKDQPAADKDKEKAAPSKEKKADKDKKPQGDAVNGNPGEDEKDLKEKGEKPGAAENPPNAGKKNPERGAQNGVTIGPDGLPRFKKQTPGGAPGGGARNLPEETKIAGQPGDVLDYDFQNELKEDFGEVPVVTDRIVPAVGNGMKYAYNLACNMPSTYLWVGLVLLVLTALSWVLHSGRRTSRRARLDLMMAPASAHAQETLPLNPEDRPLGVEPA
jgi:hypothetical protein